MSLAQRVEIVRDMAYSFLLDDAIGHGYDNLLSVALGPSLDPTPVALHRKTPVLGWWTLLADTTSDVKQAVNWRSTR